MLERFNHFLILTLADYRTTQCRDFLQERFIEGHSLTRLCGFALVEAKSAVASNCRQPCCKLARILNSWQRFKCQQKRLLCYIFCVITDNCSRQPYYCRTITQYQFFKGLEVANYRRDN